MMTNKEMEMYEYVVETGIATANELGLVKSIMGGTWENVINNVIYARTAYENWEQLIEEDEENEEEDNFKYYIVATYDDCTREYRNFTEYVEANKNYEEIAKNHPTAKIDLVDYETSEVFRSTDL